MYLECELVGGPCDGLKIALPGLGIDREYRIPLAPPLPPLGYVGELPAVKLPRRDAVYVSSGFDDASPEGLLRLRFRRFEVIE